MQNKGLGKSSVQQTRRGRLTIFDDKLSLLHGIYKTQSGDDKDFTQLSEDDLTVMLLTVNCKITYNNSNKRVLSIS